ncbi:hypothetical protein [Stieleria varia]|uniref:hypothetical protein n=1 Tax=Stieleria varia TaxID=2528005 RepID=UPI0011B5317B|nr:hypothetical protein [Stieleria varia]
MKISFQVVLIAIVLVVLPPTPWQLSAADEPDPILKPLLDVGKPVSLTDLETDPVPVEQNAAEVLETLADAIKLFDNRLARASQDAESDEEFDAALVLTSRLLSERYPDLVPALRGAAKRKIYRAGHDSSLPPQEWMASVMNELGPIRTVARILNGHAKMSLADQDTDAAALDAIALMQWSEHVAKQPCLISFLVSTVLLDNAMELAADCLYQEKLSDSVRGQLIEAVKNNSFRKSFAGSVDSERAFGISSINALRAQGVPMPGELAAYLKLISDFDQIAGRPFGFAKEPPETESLFARSVWPALTGGLAALRRSQAKSNAVLILAAWQDAGANHDTQIDALPVANSIKLDPFDGSTMKLLWDEKGVSIYSVGENLIDDQGSLMERVDIGISP